MKKFTLSATEGDEAGHSIAIELAVDEQNEAVGVLVYQHADGDQIELPLNTLGVFNPGLVIVRRELARILALAVGSANDADAGQG